MPPKYLLRYFVKYFVKFTKLLYSSTFYINAIKGLPDVWGWGRALNKIAFRKTYDSRNMYILAQIFIVPDRHKMQSEESCEGPGRENLNPTHQEIRNQGPCLPFIC